MYDNEDYDSEIEFRCPEYLPFMKLITEDVD